MSATSCKQYKEVASSDIKGGAVQIVKPSQAKKVCPDSEKEFMLSGWLIRVLDFDKGNTAGFPHELVKIRTGYLPPKGESKGFVLYLEGLGDSMMNHAPLFEKIQNSGYGVIAFDYMGQGGSCGTMNDTLIQSQSPNGEKSEIGELAKAVWKSFSDKTNGQAQPSVIVGWSTGGLAAYKFAAAQSGAVWGKKFVLIAPGICPHAFVGKTTSLEDIKEDFANDVHHFVEKISDNAAILRGGKTLVNAAIFSAEIMTGNLALAFDRKKIHFMEIMSENLTTATKSYDSGQLVNPHTDEIMPKSPVMVPKFAANLLVTAYNARTSWHVESGIQGLVLLSDAKDGYVDPDCTRKIFASQPNFTIIQYPGALHEIDNEIPEIQTAMQNDIIKFLK